MSVQIVGYGTLLYRASLGGSIGAEAATEKPMVPVLVRGYKRLFNLRPTHYDTSFKVSAEPIENGALNVEPCPECDFNGLAFAASAKELAALDDRERYYERQSVLLYAFEGGQCLGEGFVYASRPDAPWIERDPACLLPLWRDIVWCRTGAYAVGERFGRHFDRTTHLADGQTVVVDRYQTVLDAPETPR